MGDAVGGVVLFVGLGNPGPQYKSNRHNVGFQIIDTIAEKFSISLKKMNPLVDVALFSFEGTKVILAKPRTFMNLSGRAVRFLVDFYKILPENICVFHDDIDLDFVKIKIKKGGGHAGHNGLRNIDLLMGKEYWRVRVGVGRPDYRSEVSSYVLHDFTPIQNDAFNEICTKIANNFSLLLCDKKQFETRLKS